MEMPQPVHAAVEGVETGGALACRSPSLHVGDVGHTLIVGPTGAGKSVLLALMALQLRRYECAQVFAFDFGGSIRAAAFAMGGDWHNLGGALRAKPANPLPCNRWRASTTPATRLGC
jgi:type IV secretory pathway VirB4 component